MLLARAQYDKTILPTNLSYLLTQKSSGRFKIDEGMQRLMGTIRTKQGKYSEVMIIHETGASIGRLIADPYSMILYSSKAEEFRAVEELVEKGMGLEEAIREVARVRYG